MRTWFTALYLVAASSKGISSVKLGEHLSIGQKTAWFLGQRIHRMMDDRDGLLSGIVEVDETCLGGKKRAKGQASKRAWVGVFHRFSIKHTDRYLHEASFRWNTRKQDTDARLASLFSATAGRLRWKELVA